MLTIKSGTKLPVRLKRDGQRREKWVIKTPSAGKLWERHVFNTFSARKKQLSDKLTTLCSDVTEQTQFSDQGLL